MSCFVLKLLQNRLRYRVSVDHATYNAQNFEFETDVKWAWFRPINVIVTVNFKVLKWLKSVHRKIALGNLYAFLR